MLGSVFVGLFVQSETIPTSLTFVAFYFYSPSLIAHYEIRKKRFQQSSVG